MMCSHFSGVPLVTQPVSSPSSRWRIVDRRKSRETTATNDEDDDEDDEMVKMATLGKISLVIGILKVNFRFQELLFLISLCAAR